MKSYRYSKTLLFLIVFLFIGIASFAQTDDVYCSIADSPVLAPAYKTGQCITQFGSKLTPRGKLHCLVIFVQYQSDSSTSDSLWSNSAWRWKWDSLPTWAQDTTTNYLFDKDSSTIGNCPTNISAYYKLMSQGKFIVTGEILPKPLIFPSSGLPFYDNVCNAVTKQYPNFDWSRFDKRKNKPNFNFDNSLYSDTNSTIAHGDSILDDVLVIYRLPGRLDGGQSEIDLTPYFKSIIRGRTERYRIESAEAMTGNEYNDPRRTARICIHEMAHNIFQEPHHFGSDDEVGLKFYDQKGWGMISHAFPLFSVCNSWERWYANWYSPQEITSDGTYTIKDYATQGDGFRIAIPQAPGEYLFVENHQQIDTLDKKYFYTDSAFLPSKGIYMFVAGNGNDCSTSVAITSQYTSTFKLLCANGNYDWDTVKASRIPVSGVDKPYKPVFYKVADNPIAGQNSINTIRMDVNKDGYIDDNTSATVVGYNEGMDICAERINGVSKVTYAFSGGSGIAFQPGTEVGLSGIVPAINFPTLTDLGSAKDTSAFKYYLNGLTLKVLSYNSSAKSYQIQIKFNDFDVRKNQRWCGPIILNNLSADTNYDLKIMPRDTITIDRSGTINRLTRGNLAHGAYQYPDFVDSTYFDCKQSSYFKLADSSVVQVIRGSTFHLRTGCKLEINSGAVFKVDNTSLLLVDSGAQVILRGTGKIVIDNASNFTCRKGAIITVSTNTKIIAQNGGSLIIDKHANLIVDGRIEIKNNGKLELLDSAEFKIDDIHTGVLRIEGSAATALVPHSHTKITLLGSSGSSWPTTLPTKLEIGGSLGLVPDKTKNGDVSFDLEYINISMDNTGAASPLFAAFNKITIYKCNMSANGITTQRHSGLHLYGQDGININYFKTSDALEGINDDAFYGGNGLILNYYYVENSVVGVAIEGTSIYIKNSLMHIGTTGVSATNMTSLSELDNMRVGGLSFFYNGYGVNYTGTASAYLKMSYDTIEYGSIGILTFYSPLVSKCNKIHHMSAEGIQLDYSGIYSGLNANFGSIGITQFDEMYTNIGMNNVQEIFIDGGKNNFSAGFFNKPSVGGVNLFGSLSDAFVNPTGQYGSFLTNLTPSIEATNNFWGSFYSFSVEPPNNYVWVDDVRYGQIPVIVKDSPVYLNIAVCGDGSAGWGTGYMIAHKHPYSGGNNPNIGSGSFATLSLDSAISLSLFDLNDTATNVRNELNMLTELLRYPFGPGDLNTHDTIVLSLGYQGMMQAFGLGLQQKKIKIGKDSLDSLSTKVLLTQQFLLSHLSADSSNYMMKLIYSVNRATLLCSIYPDSMTAGIDSLNSIASWAKPKDQPFVNYLQCVNNKEWDVKRGAYTFSQADSVYNCHYISPTYDLIDSINAGKDTAFCKGGAVVIGATSVSGHTYSWASIPSGFTSSSSNPSINPTVTTTYVLTEKVTKTGFSRNDTVVITVNPLPMPVGASTPTAVCLGSSVTLSSGSTAGHTYHWSSDPVGFSSGFATAVVSPTVSTSYYLRETITATGCSDSDTIIVTVNPLPTANAGSDQEITDGDGTSIGTSSMSGHTYSWTSDPSGFTSSDSEPDITPDETTTYYVTETISATGCADTDTVVITVDAPIGRGEGKRSTGIAGQSNNQAIQFYPNPFTDHFYLEFSDLSKSYTVEVFDMTGRRLIEKTSVNTGTLDIDASMLSQGTYILTVTDKEGKSKRYQVVKAKN